MHDLTIVLTLYDRGDYYTYPKRWTSFANKYLNSFKILIADGTGIKKIKDYFSNKDNFINLDLSYHEYPKDNSYKDYFSKLNDCIDKVKTKYIVLADDDDFYAAEGLIKSINFLEKNNNFSTCRGMIGSFNLSNQNYLSNSFIPKLQNSFTEDKPIERFKSYYNNYNIAPIFYDVHRSDLQKENFKKLNQENFIEPIMVEMLPEMLDILQGKIARIDEIYLMRQKNYNNSAHKKYVDGSGDVIQRLCFGNFNNDLKIWAKIISKKISNLEKISESDSLEVVMNTYKNAIIKSLQIKKERKNIFSLKFFSLFYKIKSQIKNIYNFLFKNIKLSSKDHFISKIDEHLKDIN